VEQGSDERSSQTTEGVTAGEGEGSGGTETRPPAERHEQPSPETDPLDESSAESFPASDPPSRSIPVE
jgi:hypothetical protein